MTDKFDGVFESDRVRAGLKSNSLKFFIVENTAKRREFYLAENAKFARILASFHRLVESEENARAFLPTEKFWEGADGFRGAVNRAIAAGARKSLKARTVRNRRRGSVCANRRGYVKLGRLNHIGVATPSIADSVAYYREVMGAVEVTEPFDMPEQG